MAVLKRWKFAARSEQMQRRPEQPARRDHRRRSGSDLGRARRAQSDARRATREASSQSAGRCRRTCRVSTCATSRSKRCAAAAAQLKRIGEDVSEKLDYMPGVFRSSATSAASGPARSARRLIQAPVPAHVIDKGMPTAGLLAQVLVAKYADHQPLYRQEGIFARAGLATAALDAGAMGRHLRGAAAAAGRCAEGEHARATGHACRRDAGGDARAGQGQDPSGLPVELLLRRHSTRRTASSTTSPRAAPAPMPGVPWDWRAQLVCDDYVGYKACSPPASPRSGCLAHARRKFHDLWANHKARSPKKR